MPRPRQHPKECKVHFTEAQYQQIAWQAGSLGIGMAELIRNVMEAHLAVTEKVAG